MVSVMAGTLQGRGDAQVAKALQAGVISAEEGAVLERAHTLRRRVIMVDDFPRDLGKSIGIVGSGPGGLTGDPELLRDEAPWRSVDLRRASAS